MDYNQRSAQRGPREISKDGMIDAGQSGKSDE